MSKMRLDVYLSENGMVPSRSAAQSVIMAGEVYINNQKAAKAGEQVTGEENIEIRSKALKYVSRGGLKLEKAMSVFDVSLEDKICMDIGASTGGFTDCMLQNGAKKVYSIDVGYGQLAWKLRQDSRVTNMERTNIRYLTAAELNDVPEFFSVDVSFISLKLVLPVAYKLTSADARGVCLIKPQFEAGRDKVGKKGVVRDKDVHAEVIRQTTDFAESIGFSVCGLDFSPIKGPEGNIEYLMYVSKQGDSIHLDIDDIVEKSHILDR